MHCLDTSAVLELLYGTSLGGTIKSHIAGNPLSITSFTIYELQVGLKEQEKKRLQHFLMEIEVIPFDKNTAKKSAEIEQKLKQRGQPINKVDIFIAGICVVHNYELITCDNDFAQVGELRSIIVKRK